MSRHHMAQLPHTYTKIMHTSHTPSEQHITQHSLPQQKVMHDNTTIRQQGALDLPTPIKVNRLAELLEGYDSIKTQYLIEGFSSGFELGFEGIRVPHFSKNSDSSNKNSKIVQDKLEKEIALGRIAGPFKSPPFKNFQISPLAVIPKRSPGEFRLIHNLSAPLGDSVNSGIPQELSSVKYQKLEDAIQFIKKLGKDTLMCKLDIKDAFRLIPISPQDYELLGFYWNAQFYFDMTLPQGCKTSCATFESFSTALHWILYNKFNVQRAVHIIDDFLIIGEKGSPECQQGLDALTYLCNYLGVPIQKEKTVLPTTCIEFMGITIDTRQMETRLPPDKIAKIKERLTEMLNCKKTTLKNIQSLIGLLNFACCVVPPGRAFLRRIINLTHGLKYPHHRRWVTVEAKADILAWLEFIENFNGKSVILEDRWFDSDKLHLYTDASGMGFGLIFGNKWALGEWPSNWQAKNIAIRELFPIMLALKLWCEHLKQQCITFHTDNEAVVHIINTQTSKDSEIMVIVRQMVIILMKNNILFRAVHIPGVYNISADLLSRLQVQKFLKHEPTADPLPIQIPETWLPS